MCTSNKNIARITTPKLWPFRRTSRVIRWLCVMTIRTIRRKSDIHNSEPVAIPRVPVKEDDMSLSFQTFSEDNVMSTTRVNHTINDTFSKQIHSHWILPWGNIDTGICSCPTSSEKVTCSTIFPNYQPVDNWPSISKFTETVSMKQLQHSINKVQSLPLRRLVTKHISALCSTSPNGCLWHVSVQNILI